MATAQRPFMPIRLAYFTFGFLLVTILLFGLAVTLLTGRPEAIVAALKFGLPLGGALFPLCFLVNALVWYLLRRALFQSRLPAGWRAAFGGAAAFAALGIGAVFFGLDGAALLGVGSTEFASLLAITLAVISGVTVSSWVFRND